MERSWGKRRWQRCLWGHLERRTDANVSEVYETLAQQAQDGETPHTADLFAKLASLQAPSRFSSGYRQIKALYGFSLLA